ncbi:TfoX/Sxy family protein [Methylobacterium sp. SyP6R]|uniref:TfoX/Sxy family protein n=1 Tax=Methylobacterium sp. SyP6R TaxID=2718876 RepID=UPI001F448F3B|nr:TfoX/Sxy family protein [Methylobacterium sp. SyP6R]MCF4124903.1 TfoX/Sxy family protein [Methylobacterium sp. SyP6R]
MTDHGYRAFLEEMLAPLGGVSIRRMFGGLGLFRDSLMFGLVVRDVLYLKVTPDETASFAAEGGAPFSYAGKGGRVTVIASYWRAPDRLGDDPEEFVAWARRACTAAERAQAKGSSGSRSSAGAADEPFSRVS